MNQTHQKGQTSHSNGTGDHPPKVGVCCAPSIFVAWKKGFPSVWWDGMGSKEWWPTCNLKTRGLAHLIGDRLIPEQLLWVDRGILHVGPTKSLTFSPGDLRVTMEVLLKKLGILWPDKPVLNIHSSDTSTCTKNTERAKMPQRHEMSCFYLNQKRTQWQGTSFRKQDKNLEILTQVQTWAGCCILYRHEQRIKGWSLFTSYSKGQTSAKIGDGWGLSEDIPTTKVHPQFYVRMIELQISYTC